MRLHQQSLVVIYDSGMANRALGVSLALELAAFALVMFVLLGAVGFGVGIVELGLWLVTLIAGTCLIVQRSRRSRAPKASFS